MGAIAQEREREERKKRGNKLINLPKSATDERLALEAATLVCLLQSYLLTNQPDLDRVDHHHHRLPPPPEIFLAKQGNQSGVLEVEEERRKKMKHTQVSDS